MTSQLQAKQLFSREIKLNWSVIIPTLNEAVTVSRAIESALGAGAHEVIVADGGSADRTIPISIAAGAKTISSKPGRGQQLNSGARVASGDVLLFLHADNWLARECGNQILDAFQAGNQFCCFQQKIDHMDLVYRFIEKGNSFRARFQKLPYGDQGIATTREVFDRIGGFPDIPLMEDVAFACKLGKFFRPKLLSGPLFVSARRWNKRGPIRQTFSNWWTMAKFRMGVSAEKLAEFYYRQTLEEPIGATERTHRKAS